MWVRRQRALIDPQSVLTCFVPLDQLGQEMMLCKGGVNESLSAH